MTDESVAAPEMPSKRLGLFFWICVGWVALIVLGALLANFLPIQSPTFQNTTLPNTGPSLHHFFGTDDVGRDIFTRVIYGGRVSMIIGFGSILIGLIIGGTTGVLAAYFGGRFDQITNAVSYIIFAFPPLVALLALVAFWAPTKGFFGTTEFHVTVIIGVAASPLLFRIVRATTLTFASREFVTAAKAQGASTWRVITREIIPNIFPAIVSFSLIGVATVVVLEGTLALLGLSVSPPIPSWGNMLNEGIQPLETPLTPHPWLVIFPGMAMFFFLITLNFIGDRLRERYDVAAVTV